MAQVCPPALVCSFPPPAANVGSYSLQGMAAHQFSVMMGDWPYFPSPWWHELKTLLAYASVSITTLPTIHTPGGKVECTILSMVDYG